MSYTRTEQAEMNAVAEGVVDKWLCEIRDAGEEWDIQMNTYYLACQLYIKTVNTAMNRLGEVSAEIFSKNESEAN